MPTVLPYMSKPISPSSLKFHSLVRLAELLFWYYQLIIRHSDRLAHIFKRKFHLYTVFFSTENDSDGTILVRTTLKAVEQRKIIVHLSCILRFESTYL